MSRDFFHTVLKWRFQHADSTSTFKVLQITDMHVDTLYTQNKMKVCSEPLCCQSDQEDGTEGNSCGFWAEYGNDVSESLVDEVIRFANTFVSCLIKLINGNRLFRHTYFVSGC